MRSCPKSWVPPLIWTKSKRTAAFFGNPSLIVKGSYHRKMGTRWRIFFPFLITKLIIFSDQNDQIFPLEVCKTCHSTLRWFCNGCLAHWHQVVTTGNPTCRRTKIVTKTAPPPQQRTILNTESDAYVRSNTWPCYQVIIDLAHIWSALASYRTVMRLLPITHTGPISLVDE